jgi:hypothetical protein
VCVCVCVYVASDPNVSVFKIANRAHNGSLLAADSLPFPLLFVFVCMFVMFVYVCVSVLVLVWLL